MIAMTDSPQTSPSLLRRTDFDKQLTQKVMERVTKQTDALIADIQRKTPWRDQLGADDRLHTAIVKTLDGTRVWDPARVELGGHLFGIVSSDISHELQHCVRFQHHSLEDDEHQDLDALREETEAALAQNVSAAPSPLRVPAWTIALNALREVASGDKPVLAIIDAYDEGARSKREVMRVARLKARAYDAAWNRLAELAMNIDEDTRDIIIQAIA